MTSPSRPLVLPVLPLVILFLVSAALNILALYPHTLSLAPMSTKTMETTMAGGDFRFFWAAAHLAATGHAERAYVADAVAAEAPVAAVREHISLYPSFYPPTTLFMLEPLGHLSFPEAWLLFSWTSLVFLLVAVMWAFPRQLFLVPFVLGFGVLWSALGFGQNSLFVTFLYLLFTVLGARHPVFGGTALGLAVFKPHFGVLAPLLLLLRRQYTLLALAALTVMALAAASYLRYGGDVWLAYQQVMLAPVQRLETFNMVSAHQMISLYAGLRRLGFDVGTAALGHAGLALLAIACLWRICRLSNDPLLPPAAMVTAALLVSPHAYVYDLVLLLVPLLVLVRRCQVTGWGVGDLSVITTAYILPGFVETLYYQLRVPVAPVLLLALLLLLGHHSRVDDAYYED